MVVAVTMAPTMGATCFYQWDLNQQLSVTGDATEIHFAQPSGTTALVMPVENGLVDIPNILLQSFGNLTAYAYTSNRTLTTQSWKIIMRQKPEDYVYTETEVKTWETIEAEAANAIAIAQGVRDDFDTLTEDIAADITAAEDAKSALDSAITSANKSKTNLEAAITNANTAKTNAEKAQANLQGVIDDSTAKKTALQGVIDSATAINNTLGTTNKTASTAKTNLETAINTASTAKSQLEQVITDAGTIKSQLSQAITEATTTNTTLNGTIQSGNNLKQDLDAENSSAKSNLEELRSENFNSQEILAGVADLQAFVGYTDADIYGVEVDLKNKVFKRLAGAVNKTPGAMFDGINAFGGRKRCILADDGKVLAYYGEAAYTETGALLQAVFKNNKNYPVGEKVQVMVEQPRFYYKVVPLQLEKVEYKEVNTIAITAGAASSGNVTVNLDGKDFTVAVVAADDATAVATKIRASSFAGWTTGGSGASVTFTALESGVKVTATFSGGTTGVTATVTKTLSGKVAKGFHNRKARYYVSDVKKTGFKLHPAFIHNGKEKNFIYLSAYEGSIYDKSAEAYLLADQQIADFTVTTGDKLSSIGNAKPASGLTQDLTRAKTRILANNRGIGWNQAYAATVAATQLLFAIEYASMNTQNAIGYGVLNKPLGEGNESEITGATTNLGNASGSVTNTNGWNVPTYRGEENLWGNIWKWVDGLNIYAYGEHSLFVADNGFTDNSNAAPYKDAGITIARSSGYISAFAYNEEFDWLFFASETSGDSSLPVGDYLYQNHASDNWFTAILGGFWNHSSSGGGFYWSVITTASYRIRTRGGRLVYVPTA